jgi:hypothetical protein
MREKKHVEVDITMAMLIDAYACDDGKQFVQTRGGRVTISTDPIENLDIANELAELHREGRWNVGHALWLCNTVARIRPTLNGDDSSEDVVDPNNGGAIRGCWDGYQVAQQLAWAADAIATKQGR